MLGGAVGFDVAIECGEDWHAADNYANELFAGTASRMSIFHGLVKVSSVDTYFNNKSTITIIVLLGWSASGI